MRNQESNHKGEGGKTEIFLLPSLFNQTVHLLLQARLYFSTMGREAEKSLPFSQRTLFTAEMSRITIRLSSIMAWLSVQRAVSAGELSQEAALQDFPLDGETIGLESDIAAEHALPAEMRLLLEQTRDLYERVHRLNGQIQDSVSY